MQIVKVNNSIIRINMEEVGAGWEQWFLLASDIHQEHPNADLAKWKRHLDRARLLNAKVILAGDLVDATGGRFDNRRNMGSIKDKLKVPGYLTALKADVLDFLSPYADLFAVIGRGNHENSVLKYYGVDLVSELVGALNLQGSPVVAGGYGGFVRFTGYRHEAGGHNQDTHWLYYNHGRGSTAAPVTRGMIETNRQSVWLEGVDYVLNGHNHQDYITYIPHIAPKQNDTIESSGTYFIRTPGYLQAMTTDANWDNDYAVESNMAPTACGSALMRMWYDTSDWKIKTEFTMLLN